MLVRLKRVFKFVISTALVLCFCFVTSRLEDGAGKDPCLPGGCVHDSASLHRIRDSRSETEIRQHAVDPSQAEVTVEAIYPRIVIYNRVPKCASSTMRWLIKRMQKRNRFYYEIHNWPNVKQSLTDTEEAELVEDVASFHRPVLFLRHLHFVDFTKYNVTQPVYINMVRDPVDRFVSHYYFSRFGFVNWSEEKVKKWLYPMSDTLRNISIDECVSAGAEKCLHDNRENMLEFFCGQDKRCRNHDDWALEQAKQNVARHYPFIGVLEDLDDSIEVAEAILPRFFESASRVFKSMPSNGRSTKTARKVEPSEKSRQKLRIALRREMELYNFIKQRLHLQIKKLRSTGKIT